MRVGELTILRAVALCRIDARHHLESRNHNGRELSWQMRRNFPQQPVHTQADTHPAALRLEVDVRRPLGKPGS